MSPDNIDIVLVHTTHSGNIGGVARAMKNMGLHRLTLVAPLFDKQEEGEEAQIKVEDVQMLVDLVSNETSSLASAAGGEASDRVLKFYSNTLRHIMALKEKKPEKYSALSLKT